jgi:hypothetical protein
LRCASSYVLEQTVEDRAADALSLVIGQRCHVGDDEVPPAIADDAAHTNGFTTRTADMPKGPGSRNCRSCLFRCSYGKSTASSQAQVVFQARGSRDETVGIIKWHQVILVKLTLPGDGAHRAALLSECIEPLNVIGVAAAFALRTVLVPDVLHRSIR